MIQELKEQIMELIQSIKPIKARKKYKDMFNRIVESAMSDRELELSLIALLNDLEK